MRKLKLILAVMLSAALLAGCGAEAATPGSADATVSDDQTQDEPTADDPQQKEPDDGEGLMDDSVSLESLADVNYADSDEWDKIKKNALKQGFMLPEITMLVGESLDLRSQLRKKNKNTAWTSSDKKVVKVGKDKNTITAKKPGTAVIEGEGDNLHTFCLVTVEKKPKSTIYLTFDDGPTRYSTPKVLKILKKNNVKATFFEIKPSKDDYDLTQKVIDEGHTLAIHGYSHSYDKIYKSDEAYHENITKLQKLFYKKFGVWCTQTRFPGGSSNTVSRHYSKGIMTRLSKKVHEWGFKYQDWNVSSGDAGGANNADQVFKYVKSGLQKGRANVILMHDFWGNDKTINALQRVIDYGKANGYEFRAMTAATNEVHHGVNN